MYTMNQLTIIGFTGNDAQARYTPNGTLVVTISVATKESWKDANGKDFTLELDLIDDPSAMGDTFAAGDIHLGWASVDMLPLIVQRVRVAVP